MSLENEHDIDLEPFLLPDEQILWQWTSASRLPVIYVAVFFFGASVVTGMLHAVGGDHLPFGILAVILLLCSAFSGWVWTCIPRAETYGVTQYRVIFAHDLVGSRRVRSVLLDEISCILADNYIVGFGEKRSFENHEVLNFIRTRSPAEAGQVVSLISTLMASRETPQPTIINKYEGGGGGEFALNVYALPEGLQKLLVDETSHVIVSKRPIFRHNKRGILARTTVLLMLLTSAAALRFAVKSTDSKAPATTSAPPSPTNLTSPNGQSLSSVVEDTPKLLRVLSTMYLGTFGLLALFWAFYNGVFGASFCAITSSGVLVARSVFGSVCIFDIVALNVRQAAGQAELQIPLDSGLFGGKPDPTQMPMISFNRGVWLNRTVAMEQSAMVYNWLVSTAASESSTPAVL